MNTLMLWEWKHLNECSTPLLPYIFLFIQRCGVKIAASLVIHKTWVIHWLYIWTPEEQKKREVEEEEAEEGEENKTCRWKGESRLRAGEHGAYLNRRWQRSWWVKATQGVWRTSTEITQVAHSCISSEDFATLKLSKLFFPAVWLFDNVWWDRLLDIDCNSLLILCFFLDILSFKVLKCTNFFFRFMSKYLST